MHTFELFCTGCVAGYDLHALELDYPPQFCRFCGAPLEERMATSAETTADAGPLPGHPRLVLTQGPIQEIRVWLDDDLVDRAAPHGWAHVTTAREAVALLRGGNVVELSLDHDLGDDELAGRGVEVIDFLAEQQEVHGRSLWPRDGIVLHTANPYGRDAMARAIRRYAGKHLEVIETLTPGGHPRFRFSVADESEGR